MPRARRPRRAPKIIDISPALSSGTPTWPGDVPFSFEWTARRAQGDSANVGKVVLSPHCGAHADAPLHLEDGQPDVASLALDSFWGRARVVDWRRRGELTARALGRLSWREIERVLFRTGGSEGSFRSFSPDGAEFLAGLGVRLVGTDAPSLDPAEDLELTAHRVFARARVAVLENLALDGVRPGDYELVALPLKLSGVEASPVRAALKPLARRTRAAR